MFITWPQLACVAHPYIALTIWDSKILITSVLNICSYSILFTLYYIAILDETIYPLSSNVNLVIDSLLCMWDTSFWVHKAPKWLPLNMYLLFKRSILSWRDVWMSNFVRYQSSKYNSILDNKLHASFMLCWLVFQLTLDSMTCFYIHFFKSVDLIIQWFGL